MDILKIRERARKEREAREKQEQADEAASKSEALAHEARDRQQVLRHEDERARDERARDERARDERARDERARDESARDESARDEDAARDERKQVARNEERAFRDESEAFVGDKTAETVSRDDVARDERKRVALEPKALAHESDAIARQHEAEKGDPLKAFLARYDVDTSVEFIDPTASRSFDKKRFLSFSLGDEHYAISIMDVREIMRVVTLTPVPRAPKDILGILSKRGVVMPVIDLGATLGLRDRLDSYNALQRILTLGEGERKCGARVDELHEVIELDLSNIEEIPASFGARTSHFLQGLGRLNGQMYILLDSHEVLRSLAQAAGLELSEAR